MNPPRMAYAKLYDDVRRALALAGRAMPVSEEAFLLAAEMPAGVLDVAQLEHADNRTFLEAAFLCVRLSVPNEAGMRYWGRYAESLTTAQFRRRLLRVIVNRCAARGQSISVVNGEEYLDA